ncbi:prepilin-type N-terminal cleavage/methylation domain-containing protein [Caminibacter mediatlanticus]|uniref:Prepilin-type N-terminal cleavage/methylation domain-containing protein n=1 Tax=Caminibacter mediatlanticus TB-2 TaxID=391592 RepID=A0AAI9AGB6_9BACT|nr:prepilin-type N-terminal cleavage/methylation domain-containing protein [Caminibacter mediatlanticus]EDM23101.1 hypothetical protein CMTB2_00219 [Caminibacter mediatlanticus TB-2]
MKKSFTLIELIIVLIIIGILAFSLSFKFNNSLQVAADKLIKDLRYTQSLALKEDKYQPFPENNTSIEQNRSKYWFKQWWQLKFKLSINGGNYYYSYSIFSDSPTNSTSTNFNKIGGPTSEYALNSLTNKYAATSSSLTYSKEYNLSKYNIKLIIKPNGSPYTSYNPSLRFVFDNLGNIFLDEGDAGDAGDINPLDKDKRPLLTKTAKIKLCLDNPCIQNKDRCVQINISPSGEIYKSTCN